MGGAVPLSDETEELRKEPSPVCSVRRFFGLIVVSADCKLTLGKVGWCT